jgi:hypothetical protein
MQELSDMQEHGRYADLMVCMCHVDMLSLVICKNLVDLQSLMVFTSFMDMQSLVICNGGYAELRRYAKLNGMQEHVGIIQGVDQTISSLAVIVTYRMPH